MLKAILFDFDGLIMDTETTEFVSWQEMFSEHGLDLSLDEWADCIGRPRGYFDPYAFLEGKCGHPIDKEAVRSKRRKHVYDLNSKQDIMPGVMDYIIAAKRNNIKLAVISSSEHEWVEHHLKNLDILGYFDLLICAEDTELHKPLPDPYKKALSVFRIENKEAVALEDSPNGMASARAAKIFCIVVPNGITRKLKFNEPDIMLNSLDEMTLEQLCRSRFNRIL